MGSYEHWNTVTDGKLLVLLGNAEHGLPGELPYPSAMPEVMLYRRVRNLFLLGREQHGRYPNKAPKGERPVAAQVWALWEYSTQGRWEDQEDGSAAATHLRVVRTATWVRLHLQGLLNDLSGNGCHHLGGRNYVLRGWSCIIRRIQMR